MIQTPSAVGWYGPNIVTLCVSAAATLIAGAAATVSYLLYRSQSDPDVIVYAEADVGRPSIINLIIENKGKASAHDVRFSWSGTLPARAWGILAEGVATFDQMDKGPLVRGIPFLPPGGKRVITWGQYWGLHKGLGDQTLEVQISFRSKRRLFTGYRTHKTSCPLEILSFEATDDSDRNWDRKIATNLEKLDKCIERESRNWMSKVASMGQTNAAETDSEKGRATEAENDADNGGQSNG